MMYWFILIALLALLEIGIIVTIKFFRKEFQWLITKADEKPVFDKDGLKKFFENGYDSYLGWSRKPNTSGSEKGQNGSVGYTINSLGARSNPFNEYKNNNLVAVFGDSYAFCRQVNDDETWEVFLSKKIDAGVLNFGVGNYGVDQALLRYEQMELPSSVRIVMLVFVPENICRIHSYWKHYLEFGNTFAFKPRFILKEDKLVLFPNVMKYQEDFFELEKNLKFIQEVDEFYKTKFRSLQFRFPYTISFLRHPKRNLQLLYRLFVRKIARLLNKSSIAIENKPFSYVMSYNIKQAQKMYLDKNAIALLKAILLKFNNTAKKKGHKALIVVIPQLIDLSLRKNQPPSYKQFFQELGNLVPITDVTEMMYGQNLDHLYTEDSYGGHLSREGNDKLSQHLYGKMVRLFPSILNKTEQNNVPNK